MTRVSARNDDGSFANEGAFQTHLIAQARQRDWGISSSQDEKRDIELAGYGQPPAPLDGLVFHPRIMYRSEPGWPDLTLLRRRDRRLIWAELKTDDLKKSKVSPCQAKVLALLEAFASDDPMLCDDPDPRVHPVDPRTPAGDARTRAFGGIPRLTRCPSCPPWIQVFVWRPRDLPQILEVLA